MGHNGVSHHIVADDLEGITVVLQWLSYMPPFVGARPLPTPTLDPPTRSITYTAPPTAKMDARLAMAGGEVGQEGGGWAGGMFDRGSWVECHAGWARTVITGVCGFWGVFLLKCVFVVCVFSDVCFQCSGHTKERNEGCTSAAHPPLTLYTPTHITYPIPTSSIFLSSTPSHRACSAGWHSCGCDCSGDKHSDVALSC